MLILSPIYLLIIQRAYLIFESHLLVGARDVSDFVATQYRGPQLRVAGSRVLRDQRPQQGLQLQSLLRK